MERIGVWKRLSLSLYFFWKIPMIAYVCPRIEELGPERCIIRIRLRRRTRNHVGSMYLGAIAVGADLAAGLLALAGTQEKGKTVVPIFKTFQADFLRRVETDALFICEAGEKVKKLVDKALETGERATGDIEVLLRAADHPDEAPLARMILGLSVKPRR